MIAEGIATDTWNNIKPKITEEESSKMKSDGGLDQEEFKTVLAKGGLKPSPLSNQKFNELDTNKNGKVEESEVKSDTKGEGEDYESAGDWIGDIIKGVFVGAIVGLIV